MRKVYYVSFIVLTFILICLYRFKSVNNITQMVFLTDIKEVDLEPYTSNFIYNLEKSIEDLFTEQGDGLININSASKSELMSLYNVGEVVAQNIIDYREEYGPFYNIEEIKNVSRVGEKTYEKIKDYITVGGENDL